MARTDRRRFRPVVAVVWWRGQSVQRGGPRHDAGSALGARDAKGGLCPAQVSGWTAAGREPSSPRARSPPPRAGDRGSPGRASPASTRPGAPSSVITDGTRTIRTTLASISTATAIPTASILTVGSGSSTKLEKTTTMIAAAVVITRAVAADADRDAAVASPVRDPRLVHPGEQEHLVVHRQPEHDREHQHRHERRDGHVLVDPDQRRSPSPTGTPRRRRRRPRRPRAGSSPPP